MGCLYLAKLFSCSTSLLKEWTHFGFMPINKAVKWRAGLVLFNFFKNINFNIYFRGIGMRMSTKGTN